MIQLSFSWALRGLLLFGSLSSMVAWADAQASSVRDWSQKHAATPLAQAYRAQNLRPFWLQQGKPSSQAEALVDALTHADLRGLDPADYDAARLSDWLTRLRDGQANDAEAFDVALSDAVLRFADHLHRGRIDLASTGLNIQLTRKKPLDAEQWLPLLALSVEPLARLESLEPNTQAYRHLKQALLRYGEQARQTAPLPPLVLDRKRVDPGETFDAAPVLRAHLRELGYLDPPADAAEVETLAYDDAAVTAVRAFQRNEGLEADGVLGGQTVRRLNLTPSERLNQLRLGLERLRWLPSAQDGPYIVVNIPSFRLYAFEGGVPDLANPAVGMDVIVGQAMNDHHTPVFHADMAYVVFNPHWNVPYNIAHKELLPLIQRDPSYLSRHNMEIISEPAPVVEDIEEDGEEGAVQTASNSDGASGIATGRWRIRQRPGPDNSLGPIKFVFPNLNSVYLHGTPMQRLFQRSRRDFSHGCIRVADPAGLAEFVLKHERGWDRKHIENAVASKQTLTVNLSKSIPVYIFYTTAVADADGRARFLPDIYGQDATLLKLLNQKS